MAEMPASTEDPKVGRQTFSIWNLRTELSGTYGPSCPLRAELSTGRVVHGPSCPATDSVW